MRSARRAPLTPLLAALLLSVIALSGCTLTRRTDQPPAVVTATLPEALRTLGIAAVETATLPPTLTIPGATLLPLDTATPIPPSATLPPTVEIVAAPPSTTPIPTLTATVAPPTPIPSATRTPVPLAAVPTRTPPGPTAAPPLDDGSGGIVPDTGGTSSDLSGIVGIKELPETLYYLSETGGIAQVWRLRVGINHADQLSLSTDGVRQFDIAPDGTLAYITSGGQLIVGGIPINTPLNADGSLPQVTALAFSPGGDWLAYTLYSPVEAQALGGSHPADGLWIRSSQGTTARLVANVYAADDTMRVLGAPLDWRPDGSEILVGVSSSAEDRAFSRVNISTSAVTPVADSGSFSQARWNVNGNALIASGPRDILRIEPDAVTPQTLLGADAGLTPAGAQQFANGTLTFAGTAEDGAQRLYLLPAGQTTPVAVTDSLTQAGRVDFVWDNFGQQTLIVVYDSADAVFGTAYLRDESNVLHDLTALTGPAGSPRWGPPFKVGDAARVYTTQGETLNVRETPGGTLLIQLVNSSRVTITGGPRTADGYRWWRVQTPDGVSGWVVESVTDDRGLRLRTLLPAD